MTDLDRLLGLLRTGHRCIHIPTHEERALLATVNEVALAAGMDAWVWSASRGLRPSLFEGVSSNPDTLNPAGALISASAIRERSLMTFCDLVPHLKDERTLRVCRETIDGLERTGGHMVLLDHSAELPPVLRSHATVFEPALPTAGEVEKMIRAVARELVAEQKLRVDLSRRDLETLVRNLSGLPLRQAKQILLDVAVGDGTLDAADVNAVLAAKRRLLESAGALEYVESPVSLDEIGGMRKLKTWLNARREAMSAEAAGFGIEPPRGVLMLGVQGAGKSLSAKAVATAWQRPLLRLDAGALYEKFIGESEKRLREALRQAEAMSPVVLWIDEIEKAFASAASGSGSADGGLSRRMFGTLLTWMQEHTRPVFLIATANDISVLPPELLRKGRFDEIFFVDLPGLEARRQILEIHLRRRKRDPKGFDLGRLVTASEGFSGAEIEQAIKSAIIDAWTSKSEVTTDLVAERLRGSPPLSVTMAERMEELRAWGKDRCVPAD
jgi:hypothetical protein